MKENKRTTWGDTNGHSKRWGVSTKFQSRAKKRGGKTPGSRLSVESSEGKNPVVNPEASSESEIEG